MKGPELRAIRLKLGLTPAQFGRAMGYAGKCNINIHAMEAGRKKITLQAERLALMFQWAHDGESPWYGMPKEWSQP